MRRNMNNSFWQRIRFKFRISMLNENTLNEVWHIRLSRLGMFFVVVFMFIFTFSALAALIWFTPIRQYLPGYDENIRRTLMTDIEKVDSLSYKMQLQENYLTILKEVMAGELRSDSIDPLDSLTILQRTQLLEENAAITEEFKTQYEEKERDNLTLFNAPTMQPQYTLFAPVRGQITEGFDEKSEHFHILIQTAERANVTSVLAGTVVYTEQTIETGYVVIVQHEGEYMSVCRQLGSLNVGVGMAIRAGQSIGAAIGGDTPLQFELWHRGVALNPQDVIVF